MDRNWHMWMRLPCSIWHVPRSMRIRRHGPRLRSLRFRLSIWIIVAAVKWVDMPWRASSNGRRRVDMRMLGGGGLSRAIIRVGGCTGAVVMMWSRNMARRMRSVMRMSRPMRMRHDGVPVLFDSTAAVRSRAEFMLATFFNISVEEPDVFVVFDVTGGVAEGEGLLKG